VIQSVGGLIPAAELRAAVLLSSRYPAAIITPIESDLKIVEES
jgi:hypothetical protein